MAVLGASNYTYAEATWSWSYKPSTQSAIFREVLMRRKTQRQRADQLKLFPPSTPLRWTDVPTEARARVVTLLARLLRQHLRAHRGAEVRDE